MEERQVSVDGKPRPLPDPFVVAATQNPVEYEGTYPLPEAQLDRFLLKLTMPLPAARRRARGAGPARRRLRPARPGRGRACGRSPARPTSPPATRAVRQRRRSTREVMGYVVDVVRATRSSPSLSLGRLAARGDGAAGDEPGLGLAVRARLRHPGRRQGAGPADPAAPGAAAPGGRARGRHRRRRPRQRARLRRRSPADADGDHRARGAARARRGAAARARARAGPDVARLGRAAGRRRAASTSRWPGRRARCGCARRRSASVRLGQPASTPRSC